MSISPPPGTRTAIQKALAKDRLVNSRVEELLKSNEIGHEEYARFMDRQFLRKADLVTATLSSQGGCLLPSQENRFIRTLIEQPTMLNSVRVEIMPSDKHKIPKLGIGDQVFVGGVENTEIVAGDRTAPTVSEVELDAEELVAEVHIPYVSMEDNIEGDAFVDTILDRVGAAGAYDLENLILYGDKTLGVLTKINRLLSTQDGIIKRLQSYVLNASAAPMSLAVLGSMVKLMPEKYRNDLGNLRFFLAPNDEINIRLLYAARQTSLGDEHANGRDLVTPLGVPALRTPRLAAGSCVLGDPRNVIMGIRRRITMEVDRDIRARKFIFVITCRVAVAIEEEQAMVRGYGIA